MNKIKIPHCRYHFWQSDAIHKFSLADWSAQDPNVANLGLKTALKGYSYMASIYLKGQAGPKEGLLSTPSTPAS